MSDELPKDELAQRLEEPWFDGDPTDKNAQTYYKALRKQAAALIRDLQQQLKTARKDALEEAAQEALKWPNTYDDPVSAHAELMTTARIAAAIRSLGEKE